MGVLKRIERRKKSKIKKALKSYRGRFWKNVAIFMAGVFSSGIIFVGIGALVLKFVKISKIAGDNTNKIVSEQLSDKSILDLLLGIKEYTTDDLVAVNTLIDAIQNAEISGKKLSQFITIDTNKLAGVKILELGSKFKDAITVTATLESTVGNEMLDSVGLGKISAFKEFEPVMKEDGETQAKVSDVDNTAEGFKPKLYYYKGEGDVFLRAYNNDNSLAEGVTNDTELYYAAITKVPVTDAVTLIGDTVGRIKASDLLSSLNVSTDGIIGKIIGDKTITELGEIDTDALLLKDVFADTYPEGYVYIDEEGTEVTVTKENASMIADVLIDTKEWEESQKDLSVTDKWNLLTVKDVMGLNSFNNVKLASVMTTTYPTGYMKGGEEQTGSLIADILIDSKTWEGEKASWSINDKWDSLTVNDISGINSSNIKLKTVLSTTYPTGYMKDGEEQTGSLIADILIDSKTWNETEHPDINSKWDSLTVNDISGISAETIKLKTVLTETYPTDYVKKDGTTVSSGSMIANVLIESKTFDSSLDTINKKWDSLTVNDISSIEFTNVKLTTLGINGSGNKILETLLSDDTVTVSNIGTKINDLSLYDIYGKDIFVKLESGASVPSGKRGYKLEGNTFTYVGNGVDATHYLDSANAGIWLLLCYNPVGDGRPTGYTIDSGANFSSMSSGTTISNKFTSAKIGQLVDAGLLAETTSSKLYDYTLAGVMGVAAGALGTT